MPVPGAPLTIQVGRKVSPEESHAFALLKAKRETHFQGMFYGTSLKLSSKKLEETEKSIKAETKSLKESVGSLFETPQPTPAFNTQVDKFINHFSGVPGVAGVARGLQVRAFSDFVTSATPMLGALVSTGKLTLAGQKLASSFKDLYESSNYATGFGNGDPAAAAIAVKSLIEREARKNTFDFAKHGLDAGAKIAGLFVDAGAVSGPITAAATSFATLVFELAALAQDIIEMQAGNAQLVNPAALTIDVFNSCPILGCYLLANSDTSIVASLCIRDIGTENWMNDFEKIKKDKMDPLIKIAKGFIADSRLQLDGLQSNKCVHADPGFFSKIRLDLRNLLRTNNRIAPIVTTTGQGAQPVRATTAWGENK